jgi:ATP-binding cassette subfamily B protein
LGPLRALLPFVRPYRVQVVLALLFLALASAATLGVPAAVRVLVDRGLAPATAGATGPDIGARMLAANGYFFDLFLVAIAMAVFTAARFYMVSWIGERVTADLRRAVYAHVLRQSPVFFESLKTGELLSRLTSDTTVIQGAVGSSVSLGLRSVTMCLGAIVLLVINNPRVMLTVAGIIVIVVIPALSIGARVRRLSRASQDRIADTSGIAGEVLNAVPVVQSYTQEDAEIGRFSQANEAAFGTAVRRIRTRAAFTAFLITGIFGSLLYGLHSGVEGVLAGRITAGDLSQTALYIMLVASSFAVLAEVWGDLLRAAGATERIMELLALESAIADPPHPRVWSEESSPRPIRVEFQGVEFRYPARPAHAVLHDLELAIEPGQAVALVGPSGAGKTTVFLLLQRFYDIDGGEIRIAGVPVREWRLEDLRRHIAVVPQEPVIFSSSVRENIRYGRSGASDAEIDAAARAAHVDEFLARLPEGIDTKVGERGLRLSGGQRQRIAIARAILKDAPLLLLDEATSSLDAESERHVQTALEVAMRGRTTIVIAHRLATVQRADRIFVLDRGAIVEQGTHAELIARNGVYARLAALQFAV